MLTFQLYIDTRGENGSDVYYVTSQRGFKSITKKKLIRAPDFQKSRNDKSLDSRIIVAAGGSGSAGNAYGAPGEVLRGYKVTKESSQNSFDESSFNLTTNQKGQGENGVDHTNVPASGAGGGYYGGKSGTGSGSPNTFRSVSSSGTSYVAGYDEYLEFKHQLGTNFDYVLRYPQIKTDSRLSKRIHGIKRSKQVMRVMEQ